MYKADTTLNKLSYSIFLISSYVVTDAILEEAYAAAERDHRKVKMLVFTNPNNPTGTVSSVEDAHHSPILPSSQSPSCFSSFNHSQLVLR